MFNILLIKLSMISEYNFTCPEDTFPENDTKFLKKRDNLDNNNLNLRNSKFVSKHCNDIINYFTSNTYNLQIEYEILNICTMKIIKLVSRSINARIYLHGIESQYENYVVSNNSFMIINYDKKNEFLKTCEEIKEIKFNFDQKKIKIWLNYNLDNTKTPIINVFLFKTTQNFIYKTQLDGKMYQKLMHLKNYFPTQPISLANVLFMIPLRINQDIFDIELYKIRNSSFFTSQKRIKWYNMNKNNANRLNSHLIDTILNIPDVDNSINTSECRPIKEIIILNAETGRNWDIFEIKSSVDVVLLNEMDLGMARSDQQHTTRLLAKRWGFNYAWGIEFVELTSGDKHTQEMIGNLVDTIGLTGNAILSRCSLQDVKIIRNQEVLGEYFSRKKTFTNANGYERRLGARMGIFAKTKYNYVLGSVHKMKNNYNKIKKYMNNTKNIIIGGDQDRGYCRKIGLGAIGRRRSNTWPSNCHSFGHTRGDNVCTNLKFTEKITKPCLKSFVNIQYSDHAKIYLKSKCFT